MTNLIQDFFENLTKKKILGLVGAIPLGFFIGTAVNICLTKLGPDFEKYNIKSFSVIDSLKIDTSFVRKGEFSIDTLVDYYKLSKKEISFNSINDFNSKGFLFVRNKEFSKYKLLKNGISSEEIFWKNNETKTYSLVWDFFDKDFKLNSLELMKYGITSNLLDYSFEINNSKINRLYSEKYIRGTDLGNKVLENEQAEVKRYLNEIAEYKLIKISKKE